jgi:hypothetical protein
MSRFVLAFVFTALALPVAAPPVSNRAPAEMEIGYLPANGSNVRTNPPALAWLPEPEADAYAVQLARDQAFARGVNGCGASVSATCAPALGCAQSGQGPLSAPSAAWRAAETYSGAVEAQRA